MSRIQATGINPNNNKEVDIFFGWDEVPGFKPGYFFQVYSREPKDVEKDGEGIILNEGFLSGIPEEKLKILSKEWKVKKHTQYQEK
jgi:hypothetical protein